MVRRRLWVIAALVCAAAAAFAQTPPSREGHPGDVFVSSDACMACHNGLRTPSGEDVSIGAAWRASMMANAARDPYWQAAVRREVADHPSAARAIQDECAACHMPMSRTEAHLAGGEGEVFAHLRTGEASGALSRADRLAQDGVACALCHQITDRGLGLPSSFTGGYVVSPRDTASPRPMFGPFEIERGLSTIMRSATGFEPTEAAHIRRSEMCATCHTLITKARGAAGEVIGELPEQMPYHEWKHSAFAAEERSCQSCHMPVVDEETPIASVLGSPRKGFARHSFVGGNAFMLRVLHRYREELGVAAPAGELAASIAATVANLETATAALVIERAAVAGGRLEIDVQVENLTGHKLPTGYPSRRVWLHLAVRDRAGRTMFESGALAPDGSIAGSAGDADPSAYEPHHLEIRTADQVQIYESVMRDVNGRPTTGLLSGVGYLKDNRLLPRGFDKNRADPAIGVVGGARDDGDFSGGGDRLRYSVDVSSGVGPFSVDVALRFQPVSFRWARNLASYASEETRRFSRYYDSMASSSSDLLVARRLTVE